MTTTPDPVLLSDDATPERSTTSFRNGRRFPGPVRPPRLGTSIAITLATVASLAPNLLPRTATAQALLTGILVASSLVVAALVRIMLRHFQIGSHGAPRYRWAVATGGVLLVAAATIHATCWQNTLRSAMNVAPVTPMYWLTCALGASIPIVALLAVARGLRWVVRRLPRRAVVLLIAISAALPTAALPLAEWQHAARATGDPVDITAAQSLSTTPPDPATLGTEGRRFVGAPGRAIRIYIGLDSAPEVNSRVALAIRELDRTGGLRRGNLVLMVPTGSGWIDADAAAGLDRRFTGDVTLIALQYTRSPSWQSFVFDRAAALRSATALFTAIEGRIATLPLPPRLYLYGQSLGALAGSAVFRDDADQRHRVCGALWAGPPGDAVHRAGAVILANSSDPVVWWSPRLLWHPPHLDDTRPDAPAPHWLPVISFLQTSTDLLAALAPPSGHGHHYGVDQGTAMPGC